LAGILFISVQSLLFNRDHFEISAYKLREIAVKG